MTYRVKLGVLLPSVNTVLEPDFYKMAPQGVTVHASRLLRDGALHEDPQKDLEDAYRMNQQIERAAREVASAEVDVILYGCTGGSLLEGVGYDQQIADRILEETGIPGTTTSTAVVEALKRLEILKLVVATPYFDHLNEKERVFLEQSGFDVVNLTGLGLTSDYASWPLDRTYAFAKEAALAARSGLDGLFISCTNLPAVEIIEALEEDLGVSVITSNQASLWHCLRMAGSEETIEGFGRLLQA